MASHITLRQLNIFLAVIEHDSFRKAAEALGMSPVAVSEHIRMLELRLNTDLFERRRGASPILNAAGQIAVERAREILDAVRSLEIELSPRDDRQTWRIGLIPYVARHLSTPISEMRKRFPERTIVTEIVHQGCEEMAKMVASGTIDIALLVDSSYMQSQTPKGVEHHVIIEEPISLFVAQSHPLARRSGITPSDLAAFPMLQLSAGNPLRKMVDTQFKRAGIKGFKLTHETDDYNEILTKAAAGEGIACLFTETGLLDSITHRLTPLDLAFSIPPAEAVLLTGPACKHDQRLRIASDHLANQYRFTATAAQRQAWHDLRSLLAATPGPPYQGMS